MISVVGVFGTGVLLASLAVIPEAGPVVLSPDSAAEFSCAAPVECPMQQYTSCKTVTRPADHPCRQPVHGWKNPPDGQQSSFKRNLESTDIWCTFDGRMHEGCFHLLQASGCNESVPSDG